MIDCCDITQLIMLNTRLLNLLADGQMHSDHELAGALDCSQAAVWKHIQQLDELALDVESVEGSGYRLHGGLELLDREQVMASLSPAALGYLASLDIQWQIDSTNAELLRQLGNRARSGLVCTAEQQSAGRGRRGREWVSPFARNLYLSVAWCYTEGMVALEGLSLAVGVAVARALEHSGVAGVALKWPNDILVNRAKLGGILLEMAGHSAESCQVVVGVGLNVAMPDAAAASIDQAWTDASTAAGVTVSRNDLLVALLDELLPLLAGWDSHGFARWREAWQARDAFADTAVILSAGDRRVAGTARGVDERGALLLESAGAVHSVHGGEISLRPAE